MRGTLTVQTTPDNLNLQGKWNKARVIESSSYLEFEENSREKGKKQFLLHSTVNILITFNGRNVRCYYNSAVVRSFQYLWQRLLPFAQDSC